MAVLVALIRGFTRRKASTIGNFWVDITRSILYILIPLSLIMAVLLVSQEWCKTLVPIKMCFRQTITYDNPKLDADGKPVMTADGKPVTEPVQVAGQTLPMGPAASQIAIKQLGTNGGGFFNTNSTHPFENPTPLSNFLEVLAILLIPAALCYTFGRMVGDKRQGWALLAAMFVLFIPLLILCYSGEQTGTASHRSRRRSNFEQSPVGRQHGRQGGTLRHCKFCALAIATTAASNGSVNSMHDSFSPLGGLAPMVMIELGRGSFRRRRFRPVRHARFCYCCGLYLRTNGWPDTGIPRQKDRVI